MNASICSTEGTSAISHGSMHFYMGKIKQIHRDKQYQSSPWVVLYLILYSWLCPSSSHLQRNMEAAVRPPERNQRKEIRKGEKKNMEESYLHPTFKRSTEKLLCLQSLNGFYVRCDQFTNRDVASCKTSVPPNKYRLTLKVPVASIQKCLKEKEIRSFIQRTFIDIDA